MNWIGDTKDEIKDAAQSAFKWGVIALLGIGTFYIVVKNPSVVGKWARAPLDLAVGAQKAVTQSVKAGSNAVQLFPNIMGVG